MKPGEISVFTINKLDPADADILVANTIRQVFKANLPESPELRLLLVFDEVHRLLPKFGGSGQGFLQIERALREFRKWGVGLVLISQVLKDFIGETKANINTTIQMRTSDETDLGRINEDFGEKLLQSIVKAPPGTGMIQNSENNKGEPYFVAFRALMHSTQRLLDKELDDYYKYNEIIDDLEYNLEQLGQNGVDLFDFQLELKMALDKVKAGSFHMVDIYLEGLNPRIKAAWEKLGKQPKKREKMLISSDELKEELEKAKREKEKSQASAGGPAPAQPAPSAPAASTIIPNQQNGASSQSDKSAPPAQNLQGNTRASTLPDEVIKAMAAKSQAPSQPSPAQDSPHLTLAPAPSQTPQIKPEAKISEEVSNLIELSHIAITGNDREGLKALYAQLQGHYKSASKEEKALIFKEVKEIHGRLAK